MDFNISNVNKTCQLQCTHQNNGLLEKTKISTCFKNWKQNILHTLSLDPNYTPFLDGNVQWQKKTTTSPFRGFTDNGVNDPERKRKTKIKDQVSWISC